MAEQVLPKRVGWVGLGLMGYPMATNLLRKMQDADFYVYDVVQEFIDKFVADGRGRVHACASSQEVADKSDLLLSMVPEGSHVRSVYLTPATGVLASADLSRKILIDCSTIDTGTSLAVRDACAARHPDARFYDAPVSGGVVGAEKGSLTFMLGCAADDAHLDLLTTLLGLMGGNVFPCGGASLGLTAKLCNNYCSGLIAIATSEAMTIGMKSGMDPRVLANIFHTSTAQSAILDDWCPVPGLCPEAPASKGYRGGFRVQLMRKDFGLAVEAGKRVGAELALGGEGLKVYEGASGDPECRDLDSRVIYRYLGGDEEWRKDFPEEVVMKKEEKRRLLRVARESGL
ncbi:hypothetical protein LTR36_007351 [Oleoguttula mirabilis]|uniref:3-hydroxyisobutyrate dehydrogenase n=1 Tax=Oleoguttula mirabilis TaxID=1507867 RepID=A0AAV9JA41_9PEZI|nr:hypothetical protein LTR36_007351 [Oleoguttula mirabilis]